MANVFMPKTNHAVFSWEKLGDIKAGREELGEEMPVLVYRLFEYAMNDVLNKEFGPEKANDLFRAAGFLAGTEFSKNSLPLDKDLNTFVSALQQTLKTLKVGILRIENFNNETGEFILTVAEDLDCSGLPPTDEVVCNYDEGFISGIMETYTGKPYQVREIDCWANGNRVCRFKGNVTNNA
jgi:predicted hydrocarbon binding protein